MSDLATESAALITKIVSYLEIAWDDAVSVDVTDARAATGWTDETDYLKSHNGTFKISPPGENLVPAGSVGQMTVVLDNSTLRYAWQNSSSALYAYISGVVGLVGKPIRVWQGFEWLEAGVPTRDYACIFTGVVISFKPSTVDATMTLECADWGHRFLQAKTSSAVAEAKLPSEWITTVATNAGITSTDIDVAIYRIPFCWLDDESPVEEIWQAAEADGGIAYFDHAGKLHFENVLHWLAHSTAVRTFTESDYMRDDPELNIDAVASKITVEYSGRYIAPEQVIYTMDTVKVIHPGQTETWVARFNNAAINVQQPVNVADKIDYRAQSNGGASMTSYLTVTLDPTKLYAQQATVSVTNSSTKTAARLTFFQIRGFPLLGGPTEQVEKTPSVAPFVYERVRSVRGNLYIQTKYQATALASMLAVRCGRIRPVYTVQLTYGMPQLHISDLVELQDTLAQGPSNTKQGVVLSIKWTYDNKNGFKQTLEVMDVTNLTQYAYSDFFIIGVTAVGRHGRTYY